MRLVEIAIVVLLLLPIVLGRGNADVGPGGWCKLSRALVRSSLRIRSRRVRVCLMKLLLLRWLLLRWMLQSSMLLIWRTTMVRQLLLLLLLLLLWRRRTRRVFPCRGGSGRRGGVGVGGRSRHRDRTAPSRKGWEVAAASQPRDTSTKCRAADMKTKNQEQTSIQSALSLFASIRCATAASISGQTAPNSHFLILLFADLLDFIFPTRHHFGDLTMTRQLEQLREQTQAMNKHQNGHEARQD